jgi:hypothetical protein
MYTVIAMMLVLAASADAATPPLGTGAEPVVPDAVTSEKVETFSATFTEREELYEALEAAIASGDIEVMRGMAVSREEFRDLVWPTLPIASKPKSNFTWEFVWSQHEMRHESSLRRIATDFGGQDLEIEGVTARGKTTDHGQFLIHRENYVEVVRPDGTRDELRLFGSLLETDDGRVKIYSFIND